MTIEAVNASLINDLVNWAASSWRVTGSGASPVTSVKERGDLRSLQVRQRPHHSSELPPCVETWARGPGGHGEREMTIDNLEPGEGRGAVITWHEPEGLCLKRQFKTVQQAWAVGMLGGGTVIRGQKGWSLPGHLRVWNPGNGNCYLYTVMVRSWLWRMGRLKFAAESNHFPAA